MCGHWDGGFGCDLAQEGYNKRGWAYLFLRLGTLLKIGFEGSCALEVPIFRRAASHFRLQDDGCVLLTRGGCFGVTY